MTDTSLAPSHWIKPIQNVTMPERHIFVDTEAYIADDGDGGEIQSFR